MSEAPGPLVRSLLKPGESLLWSGRPRTTLSSGDAEAAAIAALTAFGLLALATEVLGLDQRIGIVPPLGLALAGLAGCVLGLAVVAARVAGAGPLLSLGFATLAPMFALAVVRGGWDRVTALLCPGLMIGVLGLWVAHRWVVHRAQRYHLSRDRGFIEEPGRWVIAFELVGEPVVRPTRLSQGRLGTVLLRAARGTLKTSRGIVMPVPGGIRRFVRVAFPDEAVRAWTGETRRGTE